METIIHSLTGVVDFSVFFVISLCGLAIFRYVYSLFSAKDMYTVAHTTNNISASIAFGGAILGFSVALSGAAATSIGYIDYVIWGSIALIAQLVSIALIRIFMPVTLLQVHEGQIASGCILGAITVGVGVIIASCMAY